MHDPPPIPLFSTFVIGAKWRQLLLEWHLPSLWLADIDAFGEAPTFLIYTSREDAGPLAEGLKCFEGLARFEMIAVDEEAIRLVAAKIVPVHHVKKVCQFDAIARAWEERRPVCWTYPDTIYAPGSFRAVQAAAHRGFRFVAPANLAMRFEAFSEFPQLREAAFDFTGPPTKWVEPFLPHLHPTTRAKFWISRDGSPLRSKWPSYVFADVAQGIFANTWHLNPVYVHPRRQVTIEEATFGFEGSLVEISGLGRDEIYLLTDGNFQFIELCDAGKREGLEDDSAPMSDDDLVLWALQHAKTEHNRHFFSQTFPLFLRDGYFLNDCAPVMAEISAKARLIGERVEQAIR